MEQAESTYQVLTTARHFQVGNSMLAAFSVQIIDTWGGSFRNLQRAFKPSFGK